MTNSDYPPSSPRRGWFQRLQALMADCGSKCSRNDVAIVLIIGCITEAIDTRPQIIGALRKLGLDYRHAAIILKNGTGSSPTGHRWQRGPDGRYTLHP